MQCSIFHLQPEGRAGPAAQQLRQLLPVPEALPAGHRPETLSMGKATNRNNHRCPFWSCRCSHVGFRHEAISQEAHLTLGMHHHSCRAYRKQHRRHTAHLMWINASRTPSSASTWSCSESVSPSCTAVIPHCLHCRRLAAQQQFCWPRHVQGTLTPPSACLQMLHRAYTCLLYPTDRSIRGYPEGLPHLSASGAPGERPRHSRPRPAAFPVAAPP